MRTLPYPRTVRARLTLWNVFVLALVLVVLAVVLRTIVARNLMASVETDLRARSFRHTDWWANVPSASHRPLEPHMTGLQERKPQTAAREELRGPPPEPMGPKTQWRMPVAERVFDLQGMQSFPQYGGEPPWDHRAFAKAVQGQGSYTTVHDDEISLRIYSVPLRRRSGEIAGVVQLASSLEGFQKALANLDRALVMLLPLGLLAAWGGGMFLTGRMLRPVREVTRAAGHIGVQDLSQRLAVSGQDEFSELAATFNGMLARLDASFEQQQRFTADASHELRTPLTVVKSVASRFLARKDLPEDYRRGMERLDRAAGVMEQVVQDLLLLARSDTGQLELQLSPLPLASVLETALAYVPLEKGPTIRNEVSDSSLLVLGEAGYLTRLFANLLHNAVRHTPQDGSITLSAWHLGEFVRVGVSDTGAGISAEHLPHLTERFYRVDTARARAQGGTGLGLAICKSIVEAHGGEIQIESIEGLGTTVSVMLRAATRTA